MDSMPALEALFDRPTPETVALLLDVCAHVPGIVFAIAADGRIIFSGGRDLAQLPFDARSSVGRDYREVLAGHTLALEHLARSLAGEELESSGEFLGRYYTSRHAVVRSPSGPDGRVVGVIGITHDVTRERRIEQELATSQTLYRTVLDTTDTGFVMLDRNGLVVDANEEYVRLTGHDSVEALLHRPVTEWTAPHDLARNAEEVEKCLRLGMTRNLRVDYLDTLGHIVPIEVNATFVYVDGEPRVLALCRDIGDRLRAETERLASQRLAESILTAIPEAVVVLDPLGTIVAVNEGWRAFVRRFSFADELPIGAGGDYFEIFRRAGKEGVQVAHDCAKGLQDVLARRKQQHAMEFSLDTGLEKRWYLKRATRMLADDGRVVVTHVDVTERHRQEEAIESGARELATLLEAVPVGVFRTDAQGACTYVNSTWSEITGLAPEKALGQGWADAIHPEDRLRVFYVWERCVAQGEAGQAEFRYVGRTGEPVWAPVEVVPVRDAHGAFVGHIGTVTDISATKRRELERASSGGARPAHPASGLEREPDSGALSATALRRWIASNWDASLDGAPVSLLRIAFDRHLPGRARTRREQADELRALARLAAGLLRDVDLVGAHESDGLIVIAPGTNAAGARACAERLRAAVERAVWPGAATTVSVGVATRFEDGERPELLLLGAAEALEAAREQGGNRVVARAEISGRKRPS